MVIPFNARIEGKSDVKNYTDYLVKNAGPVIMAWIIEGAQKAIQQKYKFDVPACVDAAIKAYRENNDWLGAFLDECCELDSSYTQKSGVLKTRIWMVQSFGRIPEGMYTLIRKKYIHLCPSLRRIFKKYKMEIENERTREEKNTITGRYNEIFGFVL